MAVETLVRCDNPGCNTVGIPEYVRPKGQRKKKSDWPEGVSPPYGWAFGTVTLMGCGPSTFVVTCSTECFGPAVIYKIEEAYDQ